MVCMFGALGAATPVNGPRGFCIEGPDGPVVVCNAVFSSPQHSPGRPTADPTPKQGQSTMWIVPVIAACSEQL